MNSNCNGNSKMFRATKIWNECIYMFKNGMPVKRHRYHVRIFPDTFSGEEAANWLYGTLKLNSYFGQEVTKTQVIQLLNKFFKSGVFEGIKPMKNFKAGKQLYRFKLNSSTLYNSREPLSSLPQSCVKRIVENEQCDNSCNIKSYEEFHKTVDYDEGAICQIQDKNYLNFVCDKNTSTLNRSCDKPSGKTIIRSHESTSLQKLKNHYKTEMQKEYWKREDLKKDFLRRLISEKMLENHNMEEKLILNENNLPNEICNDIPSCINVKKCPSKDVEKFVKRLKNEYLGEYIMKAIVKRISKITGPHLNLNLLIPFDSIDPMWLIYNMDSEINHFDLPPWIIDALACLGFFGEVCEKEKYPGYYKDVFNILCENITISCLSPLIPADMNMLLFETFNFLEKLNKSENNLNVLSSSTEDLITDMCTPPRNVTPKGGFDNFGFSLAPKKDDHYSTFSTCYDSHVTDSVPKKIIPADCCFETAFTSDVPVTRIIRRQKSNIKRTQSVINLKDKTSKKFDLLPNRFVKHASLSSLKICTNPDIVPNVQISNKESFQTNLKKDFENDSCEKGLQNFKSVNLNTLPTAERSFNCDNSKKLDLNLRTKQSASDNYEEEEDKFQCYVNYGMTFSPKDFNDELSDIGSVNGKENGSFDINYVDAINDINKLVQFSRGNTQYACEKEVNCCPCSCSEKNSSFSELTSEVNNSPISNFENENSKWLPHVIYLGLMLFRNELLLLHPESRNKLNIIFFLINHITFFYGRKESESEDSEIFKKLESCVFYSSNGFYSEKRKRTKLLKFFVQHREEIMKYVDDIDNHILNIKRNKKIARYRGCNNDSELNDNSSIMRDILSEQGIDNSSNSENVIVMFKLIHHILNDENCTNKEKKALLNMVREIYKDDFPESVSTSIQPSDNEDLRNCHPCFQNDMKTITLQKLKNLRI